MPMRLCLYSAYNQAACECSCLNLPNTCNMADATSTSNIVDIFLSSYGDIVENSPKAIMPPTIVLKSPKYASYSHF